MASYIETNESFVRDSAECNPPVRVDGRGRSDSRPLSIVLGPLNGQAEIRLGDTLIRSTVRGEIVPPLQERPNEGRLFFNLELGGIADPTLYEYGRPTAESTTVCNYVERVLKGSRAIDSESLCILGGKSVWSIRVDIHTLSADGSLNDACSLAALCALLNFKREETTIDGIEAKFHAASAREPVPLSIHHLPISSSFALFETEKGIDWYVDPTSLEERVFGGILSITVNQHGELCGIHKPGGIPVDQAVLSDCMQLAIQRARYITELIKAAFSSV
jgi:exosome complex component RRP45